jgi:hypothetical protein
LFSSSSSLANSALLAPSNPIQARPAPTAASARITEQPRARSPYRRHAIAADIDTPLHLLANIMFFGFLVGAVRVAAAEHCVGLDVTPTASMLPQSFDEA